MNTIEIIQKHILEYSSPSSIVRIRNAFAKYNKFLVTEGTEEFIFVFYNGNNDDIQRREDACQYTFSRESGVRHRDFDTGSISKGDIDPISVGVWIDTKDFVLPTCDMPTVQDILDLPVIENSTIASYIDGCLDEHMVRGFYDLDTCGLYGDHPIHERIQVSLVAQHTTDHGKYGEQIRRVVFDCCNVALIVSTGKHIDDHTLIVLDAAKVSQMAKLIEETFTTTEYKMEEYAMTDPLNFIGNELLDAIASKGDLNVND